LREICSVILELSMNKQMDKAFFYMHCSDMDVAESSGTQQLLKQTL
jgi:hypothetical protein